MFSTACPGKNFPWAEVSIPFRDYGVFSTYGQGFLERRRCFNPFQGLRSVLGAVRPLKYPCAGVFQSLSGITECSRHRTLWPRQRSGVFQSLSGITECSRPLLPYRISFDTCVSIPFRDYGVFSGVVGGFNTNLSVCFNPFQGLRSVLQEAKNIMNICMVFQSFQGLEVLVICRSTTALSRSVSIPFRDYGVFSPVCHPFLQKKESVSIPFRDYGVFSL